MKIKYFLITAVLAIAILFLGADVKAQTTDTQALIAQLQAQIAQLMQQIAQLQAQQGTTQTWCHTFNKNLRYGDGGAEVEDLWTALSKEGYGETVSQDHEGMGQPDVFGEYTASAIVEFQEKYASDILVPLKLKHGTGNFGPTTRKKMNALYGCKDKKECVIDTDCPQLKCASSDEKCLGSAYQCIDGKCATKPTSTCTDSDNGLDYYTKGEAVKGTQKQSDVCKDTNILIEGYCNSQGVTSGALYTCPNGCENGACKQATTQPSITSISPNPASVGSIVSVTGVNLCGFESDKNLWIENGAGQRGIIYGSSDSTCNMIKFTLAGSYCTADTSYSGLPCSSSIIITPGTYNIYALPWGNMSNKVSFSIVSPTTTNAPYISSITAGPVNGFNIISLTGTGLDPLKLAVNKIDNLQNISASGTGSGCRALTSANGAYATCPLNKDLTAGTHTFQLFTQDGLSSNIVSFTMSSPWIKPKITSISPSTAGIGYQITITGSGFDPSNNIIQIEGGGYYGPVTGGYSQIVSSSNNGTTITYIIPSSLSTCTNLPGGTSCPNPPIMKNLQAGSYVISVVNINASSYGVEDQGNLTITSSTTQSSITVLSPNGGEVWTQGQTYQITWQRTNFDEEVAINLIDYTPGSHFGMQYGITNGANIRTVSGQNSFSWAMPASTPTGNYYKIVVQNYINHAVSIMDFSDNYFSIVAPQYTCFSECNDVNKDGWVSPQDVLLISRLVYNTPTKSDRCTGGSKYDSKMDINKDGCVDDIDTNCVSADLQTNGSRQITCAVGFNVPKNQLASISDAITRIAQAIQELLKK